MSKKIIGVLLIIFVLFFMVWISGEKVARIPYSKNVTVSKAPPTPGIVLVTPSRKKVLDNSYHIFQSFNNCGPAALSMALSYFGITESQEVLGNKLRPYQVPSGDNDDKSVTLEEIAEEAKSYNLLSYHRPNGTMEQIKQFIAYDIPVVTRTWLKANEDIGHYRIVKGYNDEEKHVIQDDSLQGKNLTYSYDDFNVLWKKFNYEYVVIAPKDKKEVIEAILREDIDEKIAWEKAMTHAEQEMQKNPEDIYAQFNYAIAAYQSGEYKKTVEAFEKVESRLSPRTLWYQIEPIKAYYERGEYQKVFSITDKILTNQNRAFSELYMIRGKSYEKMGNKSLAQEEYEKAVFYNRNLVSAQEALNNITIQ